MLADKSISAKVALLAILLITGSTLQAQDKLAQSGFQFLSVGADARGSAMGGTMTTVEWGSGAMFFNPAGMAFMPVAVDVAVSQNEWFADITHNAFSFAVSPSQGQLGVFGVTLYAVDYGEIEGTMVANNEQGFLDTEILEPKAMVVGVGYARAISDRFSIGGHVKYVGSYLGDSVIPLGDSLVTQKNLAFATAADFGTLFKTGYRGIDFGMSIRNFSNEIKFEEESFLLPLTFVMGLSANVFELFDLQMGTGSALHVRMDASHPRAFREQMSFGAEYRFQNMLFLRGGYLVNYDQRGGTFGLGLNLFGLHFDYAYTPFGVFDRVQQFTIRFSR
jgi:hypothetical protein